MPFCHRLAETFPYRPTRYVVCCCGWVFKVTITFQMSAALQNAHIYAKQPLFRPPASCPKKDSTFFLTVVGPPTKEYFSLWSTVLLSVLLHEPSMSFTGGCNGSWFPIIIPSALNCVDVNKRFASLSLSAATKFTAAMT